MRWRSISSELLRCGEGVFSILLLPLVARFLETIDHLKFCVLMVEGTSVVVNFCCL